VSETGTIERQLRLLRILASRRLGVTVEELKDEFGVSLKTVRRDLVRLRDAGFPLQERVEDHGRRRWSLQAGDLTGAGLAFDEAFAMLVAVGMLGSLGGTTIGQAAASAVTKLRSGLGESVLRYCDRLARSVAMCESRGVDYSGQAEILEQILRGHEEHKNVFIGYRSRRSTEPLTYPISPYAIRHYRGAIYILAYSEQHDAIRTFKLDRISEAEVTQIPFRMPSDFDADEHLAAGIGIYSGGEPEEIRLRFGPSAARFLTETRWHTSERLQRHADGGATATYTVAITPELIGWILSIGPEVRVLSPDHLADEIAEKATAIANQYTTTRGVDV
jgi:proteasome accessory factor B